MYHSATHLLHELAALQPHSLMITSFIAINTSFSQLHMMLLTQLIPITVTNVRELCIHITRDVHHKLVITISI